ncbi:hypothetical protein KKH15_02130 [Patescibacteria group bacterium]|nr:hypothetical protein [Patescibacteria group bacterium]MBU1755077.1 hypothetical protein [Patescibacteria group bacterium]
MSELPAPIQNFLTGPERSAKILELSNKYSLHADQAGVFERAFLFMLLGISTPTEFSEQLRAAGVSEQSVKGLINDVNEGVFKKLRQQEQTDGIAAPSSAPLIEEDDELKPLPVPAYANPEIPTYSAPTPPPMPVKTEREEAPVAPVIEHSMRTMQDDMSRVQSGELQEKRPLPSAWETKPAMHSAPTPPPVLAPEPVMPPIKKEYGSDPYREPVT